MIVIRMIKSPMCDKKQNISEKAGLQYDGVHVWSYLPYMYHKFKPNVGKSTSPMEFYGNGM